MNNQNSIFEKIIKYRILLLGVFVLLIFLGVVILFFLQNRAITSPSTKSSNPTSTQTSLTPQPTQAPFTILTTSPKNNEVNVFSGELFVTINADVPIVSENSISFEFSPKTSHGIEYKNSFPSKKVDFIILGGLEPKTTYKVTAKNNRDDKEIYTWSFTTSSDRGEGQSALASQSDKELYEIYYPLAKYLPYSTSSYKLGYIDRLALKITLLNENINRDTALNEVKDWVKSKGINPDTHTYIFSGQ